MASQGVIPTYDRLRRMVEESRAAATAPQQRETVAVVRRPAPVMPANAAFPSAAAEIGATVRNIVPGVVELITPDQKPTPQLVSVAPSAPREVAQLGQALASAAPAAVSLVRPRRAPVMPTPINPADPNAATRPSTAEELGAVRVRAPRAPWVTLDATSQEQPDNRVASPAPVLPLATTATPSQMADAFDEEFQPQIRERMHTVTVPGLALSGMDPATQQANMQRYGDAIQSGRSPADVTPLLESGQGVAIFGRGVVPSRGEQMFDAVEAATMTVPQRLRFPRMEARVNPETNQFETVITDGQTRMVFDHSNYSSPLALNQDVQTGLRQFGAMRRADRGRTRQVAADAVADVMRRPAMQEAVQFVPDAVFDVPAVRPAASVAPAAGETMRRVEAFNPIADFRQTQEEIAKAQDSLSYWLRAGDEREIAAAAANVQALQTLGQQQYLAAAELEQARIPSAAAVNAAARAAQDAAAMQAQQDARASAAQGVRASFAKAGASPRAITTMNLIPDHLLVDVDERGNAVPAAWVLALAFPEQKEQLLRGVRPDQLDDIREHIAYLDEQIDTVVDPALRSQLMLARRNANDLLLSLGEGEPEYEGTFILENLPGRRPADR